MGALPAGGLGASWALPGGCLISLEPSHLLPDQREITLSYMHFVNAYPRVGYQLAIAEMFYHRKMEEKSSKT